jgi:hypothetical protein
MELVFYKNPFIWKHQLLEITSVENEKLTKQAIEQFKKPKEGSGGFNINLNSSPETKKLFFLFEDICKKLFNNITSQKLKPGNIVSAYVQNKDKYDSVWHNHVNHCTVNGVYYSSVPDNTGTLSIIDGGGIEKEILVEENYIYLFPGWMLHKPNPQKNSLQYRVSLNLEWLCFTRPILKSELFTKEEYESLSINKSLIVW